MARIEQKFDEKQLADLYIWLVRQFPFSEDPPMLEVHFVTPRENIGHWRDSILDHLSKMGTLEACLEISRIADDLPKLEYAKFILTKPNGIIAVYPGGQLGPNIS